MIYAKLDVCFWRHKKFRRAGVAASGYWAAALAYLREDDSDDGFLPSDVVGQLLGVTQAKGEALCRILVEVGLFQVSEGGYILVGYTTKNESRSQIEARKAANARRVAAWRSKSRDGTDPGAGDGARNGAPNVTSEPRGAAALDSIAVATSSGRGPGAALGPALPSRALAVQETVEQLSSGPDRSPTTAFDVENRGGGDVVGAVVRGRNGNGVQRYTPITESGVTVVTLPPCTGSGSGSDSDSDSDSGSDSDSDLRSGSDAGARAGEGSPRRSAAGAASAATRGHGLFGMQVDAYGDGITAVTGVPYVKSGPFEAKVLEDCAVRAGGRTGQDLLAWYRQKAEKFARSVNPKFGFGVNRFVAWLNGGEPTDASASPAATRDLSRPESRNLNNLGDGLPPLPPLRRVLS